MIEDQKIMIDSNNATIEDLQYTVHLLEAEVDQLRLNHNQLEQYWRRNSLRINKLVLESPTDNELDLTRRVLRFLNTPVLKGEGRVLDLRDIERCHFVGNPSHPGLSKYLWSFLATMTNGECIPERKKLEKQP